MFIFALLQETCYGFYHYYDTLGWFVSIYGVAQILFRELTHGGLHIWAFLKKLDTIWKILSK